ncbi:MAG: hypothetical protein R3E84_08720 [Pseudomonadales bacterium]
MKVTIYHAPDDAHLVRPFAAFLEAAELSPVCVDRLPPAWAPNALVICGAGHARQAWLHDALAEAENAVAVRFAEVPLKTGGGRQVDLLTWPARSADRTLMALADWLHDGSRGRFPGARADNPTAADPDTRRNFTVLLVFVVIVSAIVGMAWYAGQEGPRGNVATAPDDIAAPSPSPVSDMQAADGGGATETVPLQPEPPADGKAPPDDVEADRHRGESAAPTTMPAGTGHARGSPVSTVEARELHAWTLHRERCQRLLGSGFGPLPLACLIDAGLLPYSPVMDAAP